MLAEKQISLSTVYRRAQEAHMGLFAETFTPGDTYKCLDKWREDESIVKNMKTLDAMIESGEKYGCVLGANGKKYDLQKAQNELLRKMTVDEFWEVCVGDTSLAIAKADGSRVDFEDKFKKSEQILSDWRSDENVIENMRTLSELSKNGVKYVFIQGLRGKYQLSKIIPKITKSLKSDELWELRAKEIDVSSEDRSYRGQHLK